MIPLMEECLVLWPETKVRAPWIGAPRDRTYLGCLKTIMENCPRANGEIQVSPDWWPIDLCPIRDDKLDSFKEFKTVHWRDKLMAIIIRRCP